MLIGQAERLKKGLEGSIENEGWYEGSECMITIDKNRRNKLVAIVIFEGEVDGNELVDSGKWLEDSLKYIGERFYGCYKPEWIEVRGVTSVEYQQEAEIAAHR